MDASIKEKIVQSGVVAVVTIDEPEQAARLAETLFEGGITAIELTLRTDDALAAIEAITRSVPQMLVGAGTVLTTAQVQQVKDAGASFAVAPGLNRKVVDAAAKLGVPFAPGVVTPSDIEAALEAGCRTLKFFPAEPSGGLAYLESMAKPYEHLGLDFIPLGGLNQHNSVAYLQSHLICALGGSWIAPRDDIRSQRWSEIGQRATAASEMVATVRGKR